jgi:hypothetical protein
MAVKSCLFMSISLDRVGALRKSILNTKSFTIEHTREISVIQEIWFSLKNTGMFLLNIKYSVKMCAKPLFVHRILYNRSLTASRSASKSKPCILVSFFYHTECVKITRIVIMYVSMFYPNNLVT